MAAALALFALGCAYTAVAFIAPWEEAAFEGGPQTPGSAGGRLRRTYWLLVALRFLLGALAPGYVHPDEFFQGPEIAARDVLRLDGFTPWEFDSTAPARSCLGPLLGSGLAFRGLLGLGAGDRWPLRAHALLLAPRLLLVTASFGLDAAVARACRCLGRAPALPLLALASAWPIFVMQARPFSNALEALFLAALCLLALPAPPAAAPPAAPAGALDLWAARLPLLGVVAAAGSFTRFTFVPLALPLVLLAIADAAAGWSDAAAAPLTPPGAHPERPAARRGGMLLRALAAALVVAAAAVGTAGALVAADSFYFSGPNPAPLVGQGPPGGDASTRAALGGLLRAAWRATSGSDDAAAAVGAPAGGAAPGPAPWPSSDAPAAEWLRALLRGPHRWVLTPYNSLAYNLDAANLAKHGIHPRWLHAAVHMPLLFGPLAVAFAAGLLAAAVRAGSSRGAKGEGEATKEAQAAAADGAPPATARTLRAALAATVLLPLAALSAAPHQEPRFLLPLLAPLATLCGHAALKTPARVALWLIFNLAAGGFFGGLHQAGLTRSLAYVEALAWAPARSPAAAALLDLAAGGGGLGAGAAAGAAARGSSRVPAVTIHVAYYQTYMPPRHLLAQPLAQPAGGPPASPWAAQRAAARAAAAPRTAPRDASANAAAAAAAFLRSFRVLPQLRASPGSGAAGSVSSPQRERLNVSLTDLGSASLETLRDWLDGHATAPGAADAPAGGAGGGGLLAGAFNAVRAMLLPITGRAGAAASGPRLRLVVAPAPALPPADAAALGLRPVASFGPHLSSEAIGELLALVQRAGLREGLWEGLWEGLRLVLYVADASAAPEKAALPPAPAPTATGTDSTH